MHPIYSILGLVAKASGRMSRFSINGAPSNWLVIFGCGMVAFFAGDVRKDAITNGKQPQVMSAGEFARLAVSSFSHRYVTVNGELHPELTLQVEKGSDKFDLVPMIDPATKSGFFVHADRGAHAGNRPQKGSITGVMWQMPVGLSDDLQAEAAKLRPLSIVTNAHLAEGQAPGNPVVSTTVMVACALVGAVFLLSSLLKHVVFQKTRPGEARATLGAPTLTRSANSPFTSSVAIGNGPPLVTNSPAPGEASGTGAAPPSAAPMRVTGRLRLNEKTAGRFLDIPAALVALEGGLQAIASHIDASARLEGRVTQSKVGLWLLAPQPGSLRWEEGLLYHGALGKPALRLRYRDHLDKNKNASAVLAFESEAERAAVIRRLTPNP